MRSSVCKRKGMCRGLGLGYVSYLVPEDVAVRSFAETIDGRPVPSSLYELSHHYPGSGDDDGRLVVVCLPLLAVDVLVGLLGEKEERLDTQRVGARSSKVWSRLLTVRNPSLARAMRGVECRRSAGRSFAELREVWPDGAEWNVWRVTARFPTEDDSAALRVDAFDGDARPVELEHFVMEDHVVPSSYDKTRLERLVTVSLRVPSARTHLYATLSLPGLDGCRAFAAGYPGIVSEMAAHSRRLQSGACVSDNYGEWFDAHRATREELEDQRVRSLSLSRGPLISVVVPACRSRQEFLRQCVGSVLAQSYPYWEMVLVNASDECSEIDEALSGLCDERVRAVAVENHSISESINAGIAAATGDYVAFLDHDDLLEPDALWHYSQEVIRRPETDLVYCDEDRLQEGRFVKPVFKVPPDLTKLRSYNYVNHLLMVSRRVLEGTGRSGADVSGAQDYDITLRAFEVARRVVHVPRVLYHQRDHEGPAAGGDKQKPHAHLAGARALEAHLRRTGVSATVEDGALPCTYRVRYAIPDPPPLVSVIIPTRDHPKLLSTCVGSLLERTFYPRYEVILVENGSSCPETFELYRDLQRASPRVRVMTWRLEDQREGLPNENGFNYSSLINFGVRASRGDYLLFLNNDTKVLSGEWMGEMVGCLAQRPEVGVVGARLLFEDGLVQHAGMIANGLGDFAHMNRNLSASDLGYTYAAGMAQQYAMVTGACQMTTRALFDELGGYDEMLAVGFNDGDFCLSAGEVGRSVVLLSDVVLQHREFSTRGREATDTRLRERLLREKAYMTSKHPHYFSAGDPVVNPNLDCMSDWWQLGR